MQVPALTKNQTRQLCRFEPSRITIRDTCVGFSIQESQNTTPVKVSALTNHQTLCLCSESSFEHIEQWRGCLEPCLATFAIVPSCGSATPLGASMRGSLDGRQVKTTWLLFGKCKTTTSVLSEDPKNACRSNMSFKNVNGTQGRPIADPAFQQE